MAPYTDIPSEGRSSLITDKPRRYKLIVWVPDIYQRGDNPVTIRLIDEELNTGVTRPETIQQLLIYYHRDGFVVLENAIPDHLTDALYNAITTNTQTYLSKPFLLYNQGTTTKTYRKRRKLTPISSLREFYANFHAIAHFENLLAAPPRVPLHQLQRRPPPWRHLPASRALGRQNHAWPASIPFRRRPQHLPRRTRTRANGATEIWCGTHSQPKKGAMSKAWQQVGAGDRAGLRSGRSSVV